MTRHKEEREIKTTFFSKDSIACPICGSNFFREELLTGGGRLIAGPLSDELRRNYEASAKYGDIYPLVYTTTVCPACWYASSEADFGALPEKYRDELKNDRDKRIAELQLLFPSVDFTAARTLAAGAAAQYLSLRCYSFFPREFSPTIKQGISALRAGWLFDELHKRYPSDNYDWLSLLFKKKARFLYREAILREQSGKESLSGIRNFGPDTDKNYGYEGALYLSARLELNYGPREDLEYRKKALGESKRTIAKIFGLGRSTKAKPGPLLEKARDLYEAINLELNEADD